MSPFSLCSLLLFSLFWPTASTFRTPGFPSLSFQTARRSGRLYRHEDGYVRFRPRGECLPPFLDAGLQIAFRSGAVLGLTVVGLAMLDIGAWYWVLNWFYGDMELSMRLVVITTTMLTFGMGASYRRCLPVWAAAFSPRRRMWEPTWWGKVEAGIPEDDPRNPATIADNVGDNVGDVAGMGADSYESYCGSILASAALGAAAYMAVPEMAIKAVLTPMLIAALGTILSLLGVYAVRVKRGASQTELMAALNRGINLSSFPVVLLPLSCSSSSAWITGPASGELSSPAWRWASSSARARSITPPMIPIPAVKSPTARRRGRPPSLFPVSASA